MAGNVFKSQSLNMGGGTSTTMSLRDVCSRFVGKSPPQTLALLRLTAVSQQEEFRAYMEETKQ